MAKVIKLQKVTKVVYLDKKTKATLTGLMRKLERYNDTINRIIVDRSRLIKFKNNIIRARKRKAEANKKK
jgi:hypothetical protein